LLSQGILTKAVWQKSIQSSGSMMHSRGARLIAARFAIPASERRQALGGVAHALQSTIAASEGRTLAVNHRV
jgi:hypothetical protein